MGAGISRDDVIREKMRFIQMTLEEKRAFYHPYKTLDIIKRWNVYYADEISPRETQCNTASLRNQNDVINRKVSVCNYDITELEIAAIVNSAPLSRRGTKGQVTKAILNKVGPHFEYECYHGGMRRLEAKITGGYQLPAKYIINIVPPSTQIRVELKECYTKCLNAAKQEGIRTVAFPCIATKKKNCFPRDEAAKLALEAVRDWMEHNSEHVDRVIFCCYQSDDLVLYNWHMQEYFPMTTRRTTSASSPSTSAASPRSASGADQDKRSIIQKERYRFRKMDLNEKREQYLVNHITLNKIINWAQYSTYAQAGTDHGNGVRYRFLDHLNRKVAVYHGNIVELEIDAIVNSAAEHGGHVNQAVQNNAGAIYKEECMLLGYGAPGEANITGGYRLPAKYVINTFAPKRADEVIFTHCYRNSLSVTKNNRVRTVAFPCIATRKFLGLNNRVAANLALKCVREWLEDNHTVVDMIIFCVYSKADRTIYEELLHVYFPVQ